MSNSYTDIFSGNTISPAYLNYSKISLTSANSPYVMVWPLQFQNSVANNPNVVAQILDVTANTTGLKIQLPDATQVSVGQAILFVNVGANTVTVLENDGITTLITLTSGQSTYVYLTNNGSSNGTFQAIAFGGGFAAVVNVAAVSSSSNLTISGSPITNSGTFTFNFANDLLALSSFGMSTGIAIRTAANTWSLGSIVGTANQITVTNGSGVAGNPTLALASAITGINSITASNIRIGLGGTNLISTSDGNPLNIMAGVTIQPVIGVAQPLRWYDNANTNYVAFKAGATLAGNVTWTLPLTDAAFPGQVLSSDSAGNLSWVNQSGGTVNSVSGTAGQIVSAPTTGAVVLSLAATSVTAGSYTNTNLTVDAYGRLTAATSGSASAGSTSINNTVAQMAHGFVVGQVVYFNGTAYALAKADAVGTAEALGIVSTVVNTNSFILTTAGYIPTAAGISALTAGAVYWVSDATAGLLTLTEPTIVGHVQKPIFVTDSTTSGFVINYRGEVIPAVTNAINNFVWVDQTTTPVTMVANTGYIIDHGATQVVLNMPATVPFGSTFAIIGTTPATGGWLLNMNSGQKLHNGTASTSTAGTVTFADKTDAIEFVCGAANTTFYCTAGNIGSPTYA